MLAIRDEIASRVDTPVSEFEGSPVFVSELGQAVRSGSGGVVETSGVIARLSTPDRFLPLWNALAMAGELVLVRFPQDSALR